MSYSAFLLVLSAVSLAAAAFYWLIRYRRWSWFAGGVTFAVLAVSLQIVFFGPLIVRPDPNIVIMGDDRPAPESALPYCLLYGALILGMLAQSAYDRFLQPKDSRRPFDLGIFLAPVFISPIIFLPLYESLDQQKAFGKSLFLLCLVAFENGFFFKNYLDRKAVRHEAQ